MSQFDFVSVFFSIGFGLGLSQLLIGLMNDVSRRRVTEEQMVYTAFALSNVILNWWVVFKWRGIQLWTYEMFFLLVVWAIALFGMTIALYPPGEQDVLPFEQRKRTFLLAWLVFLVLDTIQIAAQGGLFSPWYLLPFILHYAVLALLTLHFRQRLFQRVAAWYFLTSVLMWSFVVRRFV